MIVLANVCCIFIEFSHNIYLIRKMQNEVDGKEVLGVENGEESAVTRR